MYIYIYTVHVAVSGKRQLCGGAVAAPSPSAGAGAGLGLQQSEIDMYREETIA
jgi:hypothetical protein